MLTPWPPLKQVFLQGAFSRLFERGLNLERGLRPLSYTPLSGQQSLWFPANVTGRRGVRGEVSHQPPKANDTGEISFFAYFPLLYIIYIKI
jgi:hypothetical protein